MSSGRKWIRILAGILVIGIVPLFAYSSIYRTNHQRYLESRHATGLSNTSTALAAYVGNAPKLIESLLPADDPREDGQSSQLEIERFRSVLEKLDRHRHAKVAYESVREIHEESTARRAELDGQVQRLDAQIIAANAEVVQIRSKTSAGTVLFAGANRNAATAAHRTLLGELTRSRRTKTDLLKAAVDEEAKYAKLQEELTRAGWSGGWFAGALIFRCRVGAFKHSSRNEHKRSISTHGPAKPRKSRPGARRGAHSAVWWRSCPSLFSSLEAKPRGAASHCSPAGPRRCRLCLK